VVFAFDPRVSFEHGAFDGQGARRIVSASCEEDVLYEVRFFEAPVSVRAEREFWGMAPGSVSACNILGEGGCGPLMMPPSRRPWLGTL